ncbi:hypothetical protein PQX77_017282 [Marasmius sp. AFHP31]|nr:hypothetical protein PQX77_017282 [Marasmius sp. AFHP31]
MSTLNATMRELRVRKQGFKLSMFEKLNHVLVFSVVVISIFVTPALFHTPPAQSPLFELESDLSINT